MNTPESVEIEFSGSLDTDILEDPDLIQIVDLDIMSGEDTVVLKIKAPYTLLISTSEWAQVYIKLE